jgi:hypothetical protein
MRYTLVALLAFLWVGFYACKPKQASDIPDAEVLLDSINQLQIQLDSIRKTDVRGGDMDYWTQDSRTLNTLKKQGIPDPKTYVANDLSQHADIIPIKPVLGGNMQFNRIMLMGDHWAIATFEDGHVGGEILLSYSVDAQNKIKWKALQTFSND